MPNKEILWLWMRSLFGAATPLAHAALARYENPQALLNRTSDEISHDPFLTDEQRNRIINPDFSQEQKQWEDAKTHNAFIMTFDDVQYPDRLRHIFSPPMALFCIGDASLLSLDRAIAMVGTREPDGYGMRCAYALSGQIAKAGAVVVSGLARGIDAACHKGALDVGGKTVALLAAGLDVDYPTENRALRGRIEQQGLVITEYPAKTRALPHHFVVRNRIVSGISRAVVVVQALTRSGSMNTASHAAEQGRDVFAVPGDIFNHKMQGCHTLLSEGAAPALSGRFILEQVFPQEYPKEAGARDIGLPNKSPQSPEIILPSPQAMTDPVSEALYRALCERPMSLDELVVLTGSEPACLLGMLTEMEIFGRVEPQPGGKYQAL